MISFSDYLKEAKRDKGYPEDSRKIGSKHFIIYKSGRDWWAHEVDKDGHQIGDGEFAPRKGELLKILKQDNIK
jgi:hypothetical protein